MRKLIVFILALFALQGVAIAGGFQASYGGMPDLCDNRFTRPTTVIEYCGQRDGSGNLLDVKGANELEYSSGFDNGAWTKRGTCAVTANQLRAPDGTMTADLIENIGTGGVDDIYQTEAGLSSSISCGFRVFIRLETSSTETLSIQNSAGPTLGLTTVDLSCLSTGKWYEFTSFSGHPCTTVVRPWETHAAGSSGLHLISTGSVDLYAWEAQVWTIRSDGHNKSPRISTEANNKPAFDLAPNSTPVNACNGPQDQHGNRTCGQNYDGTDDYFSIAHDDAFNVFDDDHTLTFVYERTDDGTTSDRVVFDHGTYDTSGLYVQNTYGTDRWSAIYSKSGDSTSATSANSTNENVHIVQIVRRNDVSVVCVDGACGTPVSVSGYGVAGSVSLQIGTAGGTTDWAGNIFYARLDEEALSPHELASQRENLLGILSSKKTLGATNVIVDGDMEASGTGSWSASGFALGSKQGNAHQGTLCIRIEGAGGTTNSYLYQSTLSSSLTYQITGFARSCDGASSPSISCGNNSYFSWVGNSSTSWQQIDVVCVSNGANVGLHTRYVDPGCVEFDDVYVYEYDESLQDFSRSTTAYQTFSDGTLAEVAANVPRVGGKGRGLTVEGQSTTSAPYTEALGSWATKARLSVIDNTTLVTDPTGGNTAEVLHEDGTAAQTHALAQSNCVTNSGAPHTMCAWVAPINRDWVELISLTDSDGYWFNAATCKVGTVIGGSSYASADNTSGEMCRVCFTFTPSADATQIAIYIGEADNDATFDGLDQDSIAVWGVSLEELTFASSYIPNPGGPGSTVTRTADDYTVDPTPSIGRQILPVLYNEEDTLVVEFKALCEWSGSSDIGETRRLFEISGNTGTADSTHNRMHLFVSSGGALYGQLVDSSGTSHNAYTGVDPVDFSEWHTYKVRFDFEDMSRLQLWIDGSVPAGISYTNNSGTAVFDTSGTKIRFNDYMGTVDANCRFKDLKIAE